MKIDEIKAVVELMSKHDLSEFKIEAEEMHLCIRRGSTAQTIQVAAPVAAVPMQQAPAVAVSEEAPKSDVESGETINSPIVGTFYRSPSPDAPKFIEVGATVTPETVICIIEAMKVMNEIKAEKSGVIKKVLVEDADAVEYGQPIFVIE